MNKQELISIINDTFNEYFCCFSEDDFLTQLEFDDCIDDFTAKVRQKLYQLNINFTRGSGADKNVIIFSDYDFVLKVPKISGLREIEVYEAAKKYNWDEYFIPVKEINHIIFGERIAVIYIQQKIRFLKDNDWTFEDNDLEKNTWISEVFDKYSEEYTVIRRSGETSQILRSERFVAYFLINKQEETLKNFLAFLEEERVNDLHSSNFIISGKEGLKIFDYSGYDDSNLYSEYEEYYDSY